MTYRLTTFRVTMESWAPWCEQLRHAWCPAARGIRTLGSCSLTCPGSRPGSCSIMPAPLTFREVLSDHPLPLDFCCIVNFCTARCDISISRSLSTSHLLGCCKPLCTSLLRAFTVRFTVCCCLRHGERALTTAFTA